MAKKKKANNGVTAKPKKRKKANVVDKPNVKKETIDIPVIKQPIIPKKFPTCATCKHYHTQSDDLGDCRCTTSQWHAVVRRNYKMCGEWAD